MKKQLVNCLGLGYLSPSGTWGSAGALLVYLPFLFAFGNATAAWIVAAVLAVAGCIISVWAGPWAVDYFKSKDPKPFVLDEAVGMWISVIALPDFRGQWQLPLLSVFVVWRIMDIIKPPPARQLESLPHGWGILMDDVAAAVYANLFVQLLFRYFLT